MATIFPLSFHFRKVDVVVIGSGAGGGVAASVLTAAGYSVLVLEKGSYAPPETHNGREGMKLALPA